MKKHTTFDRSAGTMRFAFVLAFSRDGDVRLTRGQPSLDADERSMAMQVTLPSALFATPSLRAEITIAQTEAPRPTIDVQATEAALRDVIGCDVVVKVQEG